MEQKGLTPEERRRRYEAFLEQQKRNRQEEESRKKPVSQGNPSDEELREERYRRQEIRKEALRKQQKEEMKLRKRRRTVLLVMAELVLCLILGIGCYAVRLLSSYNYEALDPSIYRESTQKGGTRTTQVPVTNEKGETVSVVDVTLPDEPSEGGYRSILLLGLDAGENASRYEYDTGDGRNTDVMIIVSINNETGDVRMCSIMRDLVVRMEEGTSSRPYDKVNNQFAWSGLSDTVSMVNRNFGLDINEYMMVNWYSVAHLIDMVGGVEITIPNQSVLNVFNGYLTEVNDVTGIWSPQLPEPGTYNMTGTQAVAFCRIRYAGYEDDGRANNQREVIMKLLEKVKLLARQGQFDVLMEAARETLKTIKCNLTLPEILGMLGKVDSYSISGSTKVPQEYVTDKYVGSYYTKYKLVDPMVATDFEAEVKKLHAFLYNDYDYEPSAFVKQISAQMKQDRLGTN